tara:strand:- start:85 stop:744 length:660 start_codon:yes stop_codon:yes gene_type:complete
MRIESKLCHVSENKVIVNVTAWINEENLGSALAEGSTVEEAEDKAISRLNKRINPTSNNETNTKSVSEDVIKNTLRVDLPRSKKININHEPIDWSNELTAIDSEIERLKWSREEEIKFLEKNLGFNNRNKITNYNDIVKYLNLLKKIDISLHSDILNQNIKTLIEESDSLLRDLSWDHTQGREYLQKEFNVSTRKELNEEQLLSFIEKLKILRIQYFSQ